MNDEDVTGEAEAASTPSAKLVWDEHYKKGYEKGWAAGWTAVVADLGLSSTALRQGDAENEVDQTGSIDNDGQDEPQFELTEEWVKLFKSGEARRSSSSQHMTNSLINPHTKVALDLGGAAETARRRKARKLYGANADHILELEAALTATFEEIASRENASFWPVLSIREIEPSRTSI